MEEKHSLESFMDYAYPRIEIRSRDYWVKVVEFLQQNWALIDVQHDRSAVIYFMHDLGGVFDQISVSSLDDARIALKRNGFEHFASTPSLQEFLHPPTEPFRREKHPNGEIYSSGRFWL